MSVQARLVKNPDDYLRTPCIVVAVNILAIPIAHRSPTCGFPSPRVQTRAKGIEGPIEQIAPAMAQRLAPSGSICRICRV